MRRLTIALLTSNKVLMAVLTSKKNKHDNIRVSYITVNSPNFSLCLQAPLPPPLHNLRLSPNRVGFIQLGPPTQKVNGYDKLMAC